MNKYLMAFFLIIVSSIFAFAQSSDDEYNKNEFFVGYSHQNVGDNDVRNGFNGFNASYVRNVSRYFGIKADVSGAYKNQSFDASLTDPNNGNVSVRVENNRSVYNFLGGIQIKDNASEKKLKPFAHALVGVGHNRNKVSTDCSSGNCSPIILANRTFTDTGFAGAFGGGLDIRINNKIDFRAIQVDYNPIYSNSRVDNNVRIGIGFVIK